MNKLKDMGAEFVTVSGRLGNASAPVELYRACGFEGNDTWYICKKEDAVAKAIAEGAKVLSGEILFTDRIGKLLINRSEECFESYRSKYSVLSEELNRRLSDTGFAAKVSVLPDILSYHIFKSAPCVKEERVKSFTLKEVEKKEAQLISV